MNLQPESADDTRRRVLAKHRLGRAARLESLAIESRELKRELKRLAARVAMLDGAIAFMQAEIRNEAMGDATTRLALPTIAPPGASPSSDRAGG